ncbi:MAG: Rrf2 family transcriptional regulator [Pseudomonadota bacterium]
MRLTSFTDFGLRALMRMAGEPDRPHSTAEIAAEFGISRNHLTKAIQTLAAAGIVETKRGTGGGAVLARRPDQLRLGDIVSVLERKSALVECFQSGGGACAITASCRLKAILGSAQLRFLADLNAHTLADCALPGVTPVLAAPGELTHER